MTEPIEKFNDCESYKAMGVRMAGWLDEKDAKIKELEEKLKEAMRLLDKSQPATSGDSAGDQRDAGDWWLALKKLKAE